MLSLLLLEDDQRLGAITRDILTLDWSVTWVTSLADARTALTTGVFDVAVFDRRLSDGDSTELISWLRHRHDTMPILMLTALGQLDDRVSGLDAGANDYLTKPFEFEELAARLRALTRDYSSTHEGIDIGSWAYYPATGALESPYTGRILLTEKENALLNVLASHPDTAFTRAQLLGRVFEHGEQEGTVDTYVHYIRRKADRDLIQTVRGVGYQLGTPA